MVPPTSSPCVRECLRGVWSRTLFTTSGGHRDETSVVLWLQTDTLFGDLRIPATCHQPAAGVTPRAEDWDECISFAGHAVLDDADVCHWYQHVNRGVAFLPGGDPPPLLPQGQSADVARLKWISADTMHEDDPDGLYHEVWQRVPESLGDVWAFRLEAVERPGAFLLRSGDCFMFVSSAPPGADKLAYEASYGRIAPGPAGEPAWRIVHSTLPAQVGKTLLPAQVGPSAEDIEAHAAAAGFLHIGAVPSAWTPVRAWPSAPLVPLNLALLSASNAGEVSKLRTALETGSNAFLVDTAAFVAPSLVEKCYRHTAALHALPLEVKKPLHFSLHADGRGWIPLHGEGAYEDGPVASHVSTYDLGRDLQADHPAVVAQLSGCAANVYPPESSIPGFATDTQALDAGLAKAARAMLDGLAAALHLGSDAFRPALFNEATSLGKLRLMAYPGAGTSPAVAAARNVGVAAHTDFEAFTFLHADATGLQLQPARPAAWGGRDGLWFESPVPDSSHFVLILSDMLEVLTNGKAAATTHRVAYVPWPRYSIIRFVGFESNALVAPLPGTGTPRYTAVTQSTHLDRRVAEAEERRRRNAEQGVIPMPEGPPGAE